MKKLSNGNIEWEEKDDDEIVNMYEHGLSLNAIADAKGVRYAQLEHRLRRLRKKGRIGNRATTSKVSEEQLEEKFKQSDYVVDAIKPHIKALNYYDPKSLISRPTISLDKPTVDEEAVIVLSDIHFGKRTENFNFKVLCERFDKLQDGITSILSIMRKGYKINKLNIFLIGDVVDGDEIYPGQAHNIEASVIDQIYQLGFPTLRDFILGMTKYFKTVEVHCIYGNHGRVNKYVSRKTNFDFVLYKTLEAYFQNYISKGHIKINVYDKRYAWVTIQGHTFLITHGDVVSGGSGGVPMSGVVQTMIKWASSLEKPFEYLVSGHFHTPWVFRWAKNMTTIGNGTFVSGDDFALEVVKAEAVPAQQFFGVNKKRGLTWLYTLNLA